MIALASDPKAIKHLLYRFGVNEGYTGFSYTVYAVQLCLSDPDRLRLITKQIYPDVAIRHGATGQAVERNIRTLAAAAWRNNPELLSELAGYPLKRRPHNGHFLAMLTTACSEGGDGGTSP